MFKNAQFQIIAKVVVIGLKWLAKQTDNKVDDEIVAKISDLINTGSVEVKF